MTTITVAAAVSGPPVRNCVENVAMAVMAVVTSPPGSMMSPRSSSLHCRNTLSTNPTATAGKASGSATDVKATRALAPSMAAASSRSSGRSRK